MPDERTVPFRKSGSWRKLHLQWATICLTGSIWVVSAARSTAAEESGYSEYKVKAAFIYNFAKYVDWPPDTFARPSDSIVIGVVGNSPILDELRAVVAHRHIGGHDIIITVCQTPDEAHHAQIVFFDAGAERRTKDWLFTLRDAAVLTIGQSDQFAENGGTIQFVEESSRLRFKINLGQAEHSHLKFSSQLLKLAVSIQGKAGR